REGEQAGTKVPAVRRSGNAAASACQTRSDAISVDSKYAATGAGRRALKIVPAGQMIFSGRNQPSVAGAAGSGMALNTGRTPETTPLQVQFIGPGACRALPAKSQGAPATRIWTRTRTGDGPFARATPTGETERRR